VPAEDLGLGPWQKITRRPHLDDDDRKVLVPNPERSPVVALVFERLDGPSWKTPAEVAGELNRRGVRSMRHDGLCTARTIAWEANNPTYKGERIEGKTTQAKYARGYEAFPVPMTPEEQAAITLVDPARWERVVNRLAPAPTPRRKPGKQREPGRYHQRAHQEEFWGYDFLWCGNCGNGIRVQRATRWTRRPVYRCGHCGQIAAEVVHDLIHAWLEWAGADFMPGESAMVALAKKALCGTAEEPQQGALYDVTETAFQMVKCVYDSLPGGREEKVAALKDLHSKHRQQLNLPGRRVGPLDQLYGGPDADESTYLEWYEEHNRETLARIKAIEEELDALFAAGWRSPEMASRADRRAADLGREKEDLQGQCHNLVPRYREEKRRVCELSQTLRSLQASVRDAEGPFKTVLLASHLDKVVLHFDPRKRVGRNKLMRVEVYAKDPAIPCTVFTAEECLAVHRLYDKRTGEEWTWERRVAV
jgi:hypothetical protein